MVKIQSHNIFLGGFQAGNPFWTVSLHGIFWFGEGNKVSFNRVIVLNQRSRSPNKKSFEHSRTRSSNTYGKPSKNLFTRLHSPTSSGCFPTHYLTQLKARVKFNGINWQIHSLQLPELCRQKLRPFLFGDPSFVVEVLLVLFDSGPRGGPRCSFFIVEIESRVQTVIYFIKCCFSAILYCVWYCYG